MRKKILFFTTFSFSLLFAANSPSVNAPKIIFDYLIQTKAKKKCQLRLFNNELFIESGNLGAAFSAQTVAEPWTDKRLNDFLHGNKEEFASVYGVKDMASFSDAAEKVGINGFQIRELKKDWFQIFYVYAGAEYTITFTIQKGIILFSEIGVGAA